jgi:hypothetical protein
MDTPIVIYLTASIIFFLLGCFGIGFLDHDRNCADTTLNISVLLLFCLGWPIFLPFAIVALLGVAIVFLGRKIAKSVDKEFEQEE